MTSQTEYLFVAKPSVRRAYFFAFLYAGLVLYGRMSTNLNPIFNRYWLSALVLLLAVLFVVHLRRLCTSYVITSDEVWVRKGILARRFVVVPQARISDAFANQSFLERILGLATLQIDCPGGPAKEIVFQRITVTEARTAGEILRAKRRESDPANRDVKAEPKAERKTDRSVEAESNVA